MKANLKGLSGIKGLLLLHGEKILIGLVGLCAAFLVYQSMQVERLSSDYQPANLRQQVSQTKSNVENYPWERAVSEHPEEVRLGQDIERRAALVVAAEPYRIESPFNAPVIQPSTLRTDPEMLAAEEIVVTGRSGLLAFIDERVRRERALAQQAEQRRTELEQQRLQQEQQNERNRFREDQGRDEMGPIDPQHPNRRMVAGQVRPAGVTLMGDERIDQNHWAVVVAKLPIREQLNLYRTTFENAKGGYDPMGDFPQYLGYYVERMEVGAADPKWERVSVTDGQRSSRPLGTLVQPSLMTSLFEAIAVNWAGQVQEVVDPRYLEPSGLFAFPLPPLVGRDWGADATHPDIPLASAMTAFEEVPMPAGQQPAAPATPADEMDRLRIDPAQGGFGSGRGGFGGGQMFSGDDSGRGGFRRPGGMQPSYGDGESGRGGSTGLAYGVSHWLLRFIDFTVEPGKRYRYRVQLLLADPNRDPRVMPNTLDPTVLRRISDLNKAWKERGRTTSSPRVRFTEWSEPSPVVGIPLAGDALVAEVRPPTGKLFNDEPQITMMVESFDVGEKGNAIQAAVEKADFRRGSVANMKQDAEYLVSGSQGTPMIDLHPAFKFHTGITVLDARGGDRLNRTTALPARVLLMGPAGQLYVRQDVEDLPQVEYHREVFAKPRPGAERDRQQFDFGRGS